MEPVEINAGDLTVRPWRAEDADAVYRACQDPDIQRWTTVPAPYTIEHADVFVADSAERWGDGLARFGVFDATTGELLGANGFVLRIGPTAEIGYWTAPWARGRGVAERGTRAIARWAFAAESITRLVWQAEVGNHVSRLVAERVGFTVDGVARAAIVGRDGGRSDGWVGSLLPGEIREAGDRPHTRTGTFVRPQPTLTAGDVRLRPIDPDRDLDAVVATATDPETVRWTTVPTPISRADVAAFLRADLWTYGTGARFAVCGLDDAYAGTMDLRLDRDDAGLADVGYVTAPWARGRGHATAALRAVSDWGFAAFGLKRIEWRAHVGNDGSRRAAEKAGFVYEGRQRAGCPQRGTRHDCWLAARVDG